EHWFFSKSIAILSSNNIFSPVFSFAAVYNKKFANEILGLS
ncbi:unnamed protein product, partial [Larinioides sclopetarius]